MESYGSHRQHNDDEPRSLPMAPDYGAAPSSSIQSITGETTADHGDNREEQVEAIKRWAPSGDRKYENV